MLRTAAIIVSAVLAAVPPVSVANPLRATQGHNYYAEAASNAASTDNNQRSTQSATPISERRTAKAQNEATAAKHQNHDGWFNGWSVGDKIALIIAVIAGLQSIALFGTWYVMRDMAKRQLRAYVTAVPHFFTAFDEQTRPHVSVKLLNVGATPALRLRNRIQIELLPHPYKKGMELPPTTGPFGPPMALFPRTEFFGNRTRDKCFTADEIANIRAEKVRMYVYGELEYFDIFGDQQTTLFCQAATSDAETLKKLTSSYKPRDLEIRFELAPMGNDAT